MNEVDFKCTVTKIFNNCPKPSGWTGFFATSRKYGKISVMGTPPFQIDEKMQLEITATEIDSDKPYREFKATVFKVYTKSETAIVNYLASSNFPGIGHTTAQRIYELYGNNALAMIKDNPQTVACDAGLSAAQLKTLSQNISDPVMDIKAAFPLFTEKQIKKILEWYNEEYTKTDDASNAKTDTNAIIHLIADNPYSLLEKIPSIPFETVDNTALQYLNYTLDDERRVRFIIKFTLINRLRLTGDNYVNLSDDTELNDLLYDFTQKLRIQNDSADRFNWFAGLLTDETKRENPLIHMDSCVNSDTNATEIHLYTADGWQAQLDIINCIQERLSFKESNFKRELRINNGSINAVLCKAKNNAVRTNGNHISDEQEKAVYNSLMNQISVITGGPGRGKTATIKHICDIYESQCINGSYRKSVTVTNLTGRHKLLLCAPTGRAAKNLTDHTGRTAFTVARIITEMSLVNPDELQKTYRTLMGGLAIVDECSMINQKDMAKLLMLLVKLNMQIILVGDVNQLPPIEPGRPFKDIINSGKVIVSQLTICFRTEVQTISDNADRVLAGDNKLSLSPDFMVFDYPDEEQCGDMLINWFMDELNNGKPIERIVLLCGLRKGKAGTDALNIKLQKQLNGEIDAQYLQSKYDKSRARTYYDDAGMNIPETLVNIEGSNNFTRLRIGDRVMRIKNDYKADRSVYDKDYDANTAIAGMGIFNGDCGKIVRYYPYIDKQRPAIVVVAFDDGTASFIECDPEKVNSCELILGYASTIHKAQGCEYDTVLISMPKKLMTIPNHFGSRNLLYTAITRAKKTIKILGDRDAFNYCIDTEALPRHSTMAARI